MLCSNVNLLFNLCKISAELLNRIMGLIFEENIKISRMHVNVQLYTNILCGVPKSSGNSRMLNHFLMLIRITRANL